MVILIVDAIVMLPSVAVSYVTAPWGGVDVTTDPWLHDLRTAVSDSLLILNPALILINAALMGRAWRAGRWPGVMGWLTFMAGTAFGALYEFPLALVALL